MAFKKHAGRVVWPLVDQGIASLGTFATTILLARTLSAHEYGVFALFLGAMMALHMVSSSLLFYPLAIRRGVVGEARAALLLGTSLTLLAGFCLPAVTLLGVAALMAERGDLILPLCAYFLCWQAQEALRRTLFADLRFAAALPGDAISYLGQVVLVFALARYGSLTLANALYAMAATSGLAALLQAAQTGSVTRPRGAASVRQVIGDFWTLGSWSLANNLLSILRVQVLVWVLAALSGATLPALLQAATNVVNLTNPLVIGLCNIIPQMAARAYAAAQARAESEGTANLAAWHAARPIALAGAPVALLFFLVVVLAPQPVLTLLYGADSPYLGLATPIRLLALAAVSAYATDMVCAYFHGIAVARQALIVNGIGAAVSVIAVVPLVLGFGLNGACIALCVASLARLVVSQVLFNRLLASDRPAGGPALVSPAHG